MIQRRTLGDLLIQSSENFPSRKALVMPNTELSYRQLLLESMAVARGIIGMGVAPRQHVGILATNGIPLVTGIFGAILANCVAVPLSARHKAHELGYIIDNADIELILTSAADTAVIDFRKILCNALPDLGKADENCSPRFSNAERLQQIVLLDGEPLSGYVARDIFDIAGETTNPDRVYERLNSATSQDTALILYTSGTTAEPKGCLLSHHAITSGPVDRAKNRLRYKDHDVTWGGGPLYHIGSLAPFIGSIGAGGTYLTDVVFEPGRALELMEREGVTVAWPWFPAILQPLIDHPDFSPSRLANLAKILMIGPEALIHRLQATLPAVECIQACGMTETAGIFALSGPNETLSERATSHGKAYPGVELRIINPDSGDDLQPNKVGEILVRGACLMDGYYRSPDKTRKTLDKDGWLHTGDLYSITQDGRLTFNGRIKDMLKVGGENVAAIEVESYLCSHPSVRTAEVVGIPDERLDEVPVAFVELYHDRPSTETELVAFCKGRIASYKIPRKIVFMTQAEWPMSETKVDKRRLRERLASGA